MAETVQHNSGDQGSGTGVVGIVAIVILVMVGLFVLLRWMPKETQEPGINVNVPLPTEGGGSENNNPYP